jgi:hypothetical protein
MSMVDAGSLRWRVIDLRQRRAQGTAEHRAVFDEESIMANPTPKLPAQPHASTLAGLGSWPIAMVQGWLEMQRLQWDALTAWQQSYATFSKDFWEQWACRYAGGIPIDV